ncbi:MAG: hypothetical protein NC114_09610 [Ruminococcus flavefaciens]|nr:hypothetical protein [Ruminococcus flavefaciens]
MKKLWIGLTAISLSLCSLQAQETTAPRILGFSCGSSSVTSLDVSGCTALTSLSCSSNQLTELDVSKNTALTSLDCERNKLTSLNVSGCSALSSLNCYSNDLTSLDVSGCIALKTLAGYWTSGSSDHYYLTVDTLKIHGVSMETLSIGAYSTIGLLDAQGCTSLRSISGHRYSESPKSIGRINLHDCSNLESLDCAGSSGSKGSLKALDIRGCTALTELNCQYNELDSLNVSDCAALTELNCAYNNLTYLHLSKHTALTSFDCHSNSLTNLDVSNCSALTSLDCSSNNLPNLDVSNCSALTSLSCSSNNLPNLDVSNCSALTSLSCYSNNLTNLDVSNCSALTSLNCRYNRIPLSSLYETLTQVPQLSSFVAFGQSDSIVILIDQDFDLSSERIIGQILTSFELTDAYNKEVSEDFWTENRFVFQFHEPLKYKLVLRNDNISTNYPVFTWHISVVEEMPSCTVKVSANNTEWGTANITGNGIYGYGSEATVTATPKEGYRFVNWTKKNGTVFSTEAVHTFAVTADMELTANFEEDPNPVGNETYVANNFRVWAQDCVIYLSAYKGDVQVYNTVGQCLYNGRATAIPVRNSGLYIVKAGRMTSKVIVR